MKLLYVIPALFATICVACPGTDSMTAEQRAKAKNPHGLPADFKFRFVDEKTEAEYHEARKLFEETNKKAETDKKTESDKKTDTWQAITAPYCLKTLGVAPVRSAANTCAAYNIVQPYFQSSIDNLNGDVYWLSTVYGAIVRLAFHDAAEVDITCDDDIFGPDGCLSYDDGHAGLVDMSSVIYYAVEPLYQQVCDKITRADFWVMLAKLALHSAEPTGTMTIDYQYGRTDASYSAGCSITGRLPSSEGTVDEMYRVFVTQMGMDLNDAATLLGAHTLGHMHTYYSGYGTWNDLSDGLANAFDDTPHIFDNNYYYNMLINTWTSQSAPANSGLVQFQMSGNSDMVLLPADISLSYIRTGYTTFTAQSCGPYAVATSYSWVNGKYTANYGYGCTPSSTVMPLTCWQSCNHGNSNSYFLAQFRSAWNKMVCAGYGVPAATTGASASGKLGTLYYLDLDTC